MKMAIFLFGLPCSGKTTYLYNRFKKELSLSTSVVISADNLKEKHPEYNPEKSHELHQWSVERAEQQLYNEISHETPFIVFDGGGINTKYNKRLMIYAKNNGYEITLVVLRTPLHVCIERNKVRERKIPEEAIIDKDVRFDKCLHNLLPLCKVVETICYFTHKNIFVDMDGTIAAYQQLPLDEFGCVNFYSGEYFKYTLPVKPIINKLLWYQEQGSKLYIFSAIPDNICLRHKNEWLDEHFPIPNERRFFIGNKKYKAVMLRNILREHQIDTKDVTMIDDHHETLIGLQKIGVNAIHTSEFLSKVY